MPASGARRPRNWLKIGGFGALGALVLGVGLLHVVPLTGYVGAVQELMSERLQAPVSVSSVRYALLPSPRLTLERVTVGKLQEIKIDDIVVEAGPLALITGARDFDSVTVNSVRAEEDALALIPGWLRPRTGGQPLNVRRLKLTSVRIALKGVDIAPFDADVALAADGALKDALLSHGSLRVKLSPKGNAISVALEARNWKPPLGPDVIFDDLTVGAVFDAQHASFTSIEGRLGSGTVKGTAKASWASGIRVAGSFNVTNGELSQLLPSFTRDFTATGTLTASASYELRGAALPSLFDAPRVEANFTLEKGVLNNVDIVRGVQGTARDGVRGGRTSYNELGGTLQVANNTYSYRQMRMSSGAMQAAGNFDISPNGELSGRISAELGSKSVVVARANLTVAGNLKTPVLKP